MAALHHVLAAHGHVVAQVVEAELGVGAVGDVGVVLRAPLLGGHVGLDDADLEAEEAVDLAHPLGVALGQVVVDGDEVRALAGERVEVHRHGGDERLALAGLHLGDVAVVQDDAADHLDVEGAHAEGALGGLADDGEASESRSSSGSPFSRRWRNSAVLARSSLVAQAGDVGLELGDPRGLLLERLEAPALAGVQQLVDDLDHWGTAPGISEMRSTPIVAQRAAASHARAGAAGGDSDAA